MSQKIPLNFEIGISVCIQTVAHLYKGTPLSNKQEWTTDTTKAQMTLEGIKKPVLKGYLLYDSIFLLGLERQTIVMENRSVVARG